MKETAGLSVAVVGIGGIFPDAPDRERFWDNIRNARSAARDVPEGRWQIPSDVAYDPEVGKPDHVYSRRGCFIEGIPPLTTLTDLRIDTALLADLDPLFHLLVHAGKCAFDDGVTDRVDRSRIGVIIGNLVLPSEKSSLLTSQWIGRSFEEALLGKCVDNVSTDPLNRYVAGLPAGILAHALGLGGTSFTLDAACASSLYAIKLAMDELLSGRADAMLTGGLSRPDPLYTQMGFSQLRALSKRGICSPFDASGDGLVVGEGAGIFLLKRVPDAVAHGDRIYGIIRSVGLANDVGGSLLAPMSEGQLRAMRAAYASAGWEPSDVDLIECHATGTPVGDATEIASLRELWGENGAENGSCVIGSVKSNIGHTLTAAGAAALTKVLLSMREGMLPPTAGFTAPQPGMQLECSPFRVLKETVPWNRRGENVPRRAAVSAFGFGGINAHLLVEEWTDRSAAIYAQTQTSKAVERPLVAVVGMDARFGPWGSLRSFQERVLGGDTETSPSVPANWHGAQSANWFRGDGLDSTEFAGFYLDDIKVKADQFRIPPREIEEMLPQQLLMLQAAAGALEDAGLDRDDNLSTAVLIGIALDLKSTGFSYRWSLPERAKLWGSELGSEISSGDLSDWIGQLRDAAGPPLTANRTMGALGSVVASRIAREFRAGGPSFTLSSEENSGLSALEIAVRLLQNGEVNRAVVGAVDLAGDIRAVLGHHAVRPLSRSGRGTPLDALADGSLVGEGAAAVVLKRVEDAEKDGDRIYAVIRAVGSTSGATLLPGDDAYCRSVETAYRDAGPAGSSMDYLEAAASGHPAEDRMETKALARLFTTVKGMPSRNIPITAIKGSIGHCGAASGFTSFVRGCLALHLEIIPGSRGIENPAPEIAAIRQLAITSSPRYWLRNRLDGPRRSGVTSVSITGACCHLILEGWDKPSGHTEAERTAPVGRAGEYLFACTGESSHDLTAELEYLKQKCSEAGLHPLPSLAAEWRRRFEASDGKPLAIALVARNSEELLSLVTLGIEAVASGETAVPHPGLRDRLFYSAKPLYPDGTIAFVFPGSGNHFPGMGLELSSQWPTVYHRQDSENLRLKDQFRPDLFWNGASKDELDNDHKAVIFGQVSIGCAVSDLVRSFGVQPRSVIGYSLGESAALFALRAWKERDLMLSRMNSSTLFTRDLAGECLAAKRAWGLPEGKPVSWSIGVVEATSREVRHALRTTPLVYLLIVNTPDECVIGGDFKSVKRMVAMLGCRFHPLAGVTTVHCEVAKEVAEQYHDLHLFATSPPQNISFYSGARKCSYPVTRESAANSILAQAVEGIDFPAVINAAYDEGVRIFLEMGPGSSCSRMIGRILEGRPHLARSACYQGQDPSSLINRMLASLIAERVPLDISHLFDEPEVRISSAPAGTLLRIPIGGKPFTPPKPPQRKLQIQDKPLAFDSPPPLSAALHTASSPCSAGQDTPVDPLVREIAANQEARMKAHEAYLRFSASVTQSMADAIGLQLSLIEGSGLLQLPKIPARVALNPAPTLPPLFDSELCLEFARGSAARMLGPAFTEADSFPTRVRLPDEPLMLVDRIITLEGEARSMTSGRVVTEHTILPGAWYLDACRIPTCIAVEAGQADLFLSGYLGIDFITRGLSVYRLLDAVVTFHRQLPGPGDTIRYDIRIDRFFRQGNTWLFRFLFDATVNGEPLLTMRDGCAGFFSEEELAAGKGIVRPGVDLRPTTGIRPDNWQDLVPMDREGFTAEQLDHLRAGDLAGCFGSRFSELGVARPLTIPGGRMRLVHRVKEIDPAGGRCGLGIIRAEADISPDDWFLTCHFVDDRVMPGTLMYECCMHTLRIFLMRMGWVAERDGSVWEPVPGVASSLRCRGQVLETTRIAGYEVTIRELGYAPEPYAICDALMYADGRPIVEITNMSVRLTGTTKEKLADMWSRKSHTSLSADVKPAIYTKEQILAYSNGKPSEGFGEPYRIFDAGRKIARLPGPPFQFMDRVTAVRGEPWKMEAGAMAEAQYDLPSDAWFFAAERSPRMPFSVLLETALQPCGWLAAYVGSALTSPIDLSFRNLGGSAVQHRPVTPDSGTLTAAATLKKVATSGGMVIQEFDFSVSDSSGVVYDGETMFGFFSKDALANQIGIRDALLYQPTAAECEGSRNIPYPDEAPFPERTLRMIDRIEMFIPDGGPKGLGYIRGTKDVDPDEWFFKAHFFEDPVTPGSLGLESFIQLLKFVAMERFGMPKPAVVALETKHNWLYRGQIVPGNRLVTVEAWITSVDTRAQTLTADGSLSVDGKMIYQMKQFTVVPEP